MTNFNGHNVEGSIGGVVEVQSAVNTFLRSQGMLTNTLWNKNKRSVRVA